MKYCGYCGAKLQDEFKFCSSCGKAVDFEKAEEESAPSESLTVECEAEKCERVECEQASSVQSPVVTAVKQEEAQKSKKSQKLKNSIMGFAFGVGGLLSAIYCLIPLLNLFVFLPAFIVFTVLSKKFLKKHISLGNRENGFYKAGKIVSTVAIPLGCVFPFLGILLLL